MAAPGGTGVSRSVHRGHRRGEPGEADARISHFAGVGDWGGHLPFEGGVPDLCRNALQAFASLGCRIDEATPAFPAEDIWHTSLTWLWRADLGLHAFYADPGARERLKPEALWEIEQGEKFSRLNVSRAVTVRDLYHRSVLRLFDTYDYVLAPAARPGRRTRRQADQGRRQGRHVVHLRQP